LVLWDNLPAEEATWEDASFIQTSFPTFKPWSLDSSGRQCQDQLPIGVFYVRLKQRDPTAQMLSYRFVF
jgi:hypothetical protein